MPRLPARSAPILFGFVLSGLMSLVVSGVATLRTTGLTAALPDTWFASWTSAWPVAFPVVLIVAPPVRRIVGWICQPPTA